MQLIAFLLRLGFDDAELAEVGDEPLENPSADLVHLLSNETQVTAETPPCFIWHSAEDNAVPVENSLQFAAALRRAGVPFELHIYEKGAHGVGLPAPDNNAPAWDAACLAWLKGRHFLDAPAPSQPAKP